MKTVIEIVVAALILFTGGFVIGVQTDIGSKYQAGRLSACNDIIGTLFSPAVAAGLLKCVPHDGDVAIKAGDSLFSLDGKTKF